jgi:DHA2 family multidrug resistance protein
MTTATLVLNENNESLYERRWLIIATIMMVAMLEVLDSTIVNVALPAMMSSLGANQNQITWVLTSYVVASAIMLPLTGFLSNRLGQKELLLINISGFLVSSVLCGAAHSLPEMVLFRVMQGMFGAALIPLSQAILRNTFPLAEQGKAMAIWGIGIMAAPVFGPTLGGYITQHISWRWIFYINLPICALGILLTLWVIPKTAKQFQKIDWLGLILMVVGIGALQIFLDKGNENDWLNSNLILALLVTSIFCLSYFIIRSVKHASPVIKLKIYKNRNFSICCLLLFLYCGTVFGLVTLEPIMLEQLFNYPAVTAGWIMAPLGLASGIAMMFVPMLMKRINIKIIFSIAMLCCAYGAYRFAHINLDASMSEFLFNNACIGLGMGMFVVPLATYALATIDRHDVTEGSGLFSYARMLGTSVGISLLSTLVTRMTQVSWHTMVSHLTIFNPQLATWFAKQHLPYLSPLGIARLASQLQYQSSLLGFLDGFKVIAIVFVILIPFIFTLKTVDFDKPVEGIH